MKVGIQVTSTQHEYIVALKDSPKTTNDLMRAFSVSMRAAGRMLKILRDAGLIESLHVEGVRGNVRIHSLTTPYAELIENGLIVANQNTSKRNPILNNEILYAAKLRNTGLIGQGLSEAHQRRFPQRAAGSIKWIVATARKRKLCR